jgi:hypothetical protein
MNPNLDLSQCPVELWHCNDERLPKNNEIQRTPPDKQFLDTLHDANDQLQPILVGCDFSGAWFLAFGRRRLLAIRHHFETGDGSGYIRVLVVKELSRDDAATIALIENAQRAINGVADYAAIRHLLMQALNYGDIAKKIGKPKSYVATIDKKYSRVPQWALRATLDGKMAETTALQIGGFASKEQEECRTKFEKDGKLSNEEANKVRRFIRQEMVVAMSPGLGFSQQYQTMVYPRADIEMIASLLTKQDYVGASNYVTTLLAQ